MATEERCVIYHHAHLCGDCAVEWLMPEFRSEEFEAWRVSFIEEGQPVMAMRLVRSGDITDRNVGCAACWSIGFNWAGSWAVEITIDGDG